MADKWHGDGCGQAHLVCCVTLSYDKQRGFLSHPEFRSDAWKLIALGRQGIGAAV